MTDFSKSVPVSTQVPSGGIGFGGVLAVLFIGLKLGGIIDWSWWWILAPLWLPCIIALSIFMPIFIVILYRMKKAKDKLKLRYEKEKM